MKISPWVAAALVTAMLVSGPLAPMAALAQAQKTDQAAPPAGMEPPLTSQKPGQEPVPVDPPESMLMPAVEPISSHEPTEGDATGAGFLNVVYVPGKAIICTAGALTATAVMLLTLGSGYRSARDVFMEGCSTPWVLTPDNVSGKIPGPGDPGYDPSGRY